MTGVLLLDKPEGVTSAGVIRALKPRLAGTQGGASRHARSRSPAACCRSASARRRRSRAISWRSTRPTTGRSGSAPRRTPSIARGVTVETQPVPPLDRRGARCRRRARSSGGSSRCRRCSRRSSAVACRSTSSRGRGSRSTARRATVEITRFTLTLAAPDRIDFSVACSKGTYVRVLAADVGRALGTVAHLERLRRTRVGRFAVEEAVSLAAIEALPPTTPLPLLAVRAALAEYRGSWPRPSRCSRGSGRGARTCSRHCPRRRRRRDGPRAR